MLIYWKIEKDKVKNLFMERRDSVMGLFKNFINQTRKPKGFLGKIMLKAMNGGHSKMADWGISQLNKISPAEIVDLGCGGGRNAGELLKRYPYATVTAIDYSPLSVKKTREYNKKMIESGRCIVQKGDVSDLTLEKGKYDLATAFETIYFWPGLEHCFSEVYKILKSNASFMIMNELDGNDEAGLKFEKIIEGMKIPTVQEIETALKKAGFSKVNIHHHKAKSWICIIADK